VSKDLCLDDGLGGRKVLSLEPEKKARGRNKCNCEEKKKKKQRAELQMG